MKQMNKKGILENFNQFATALVGLGVLFAVGFLIFAKVAANTDVAADGNATAAINSLRSEMQGLITWIGIVIIVGVGGLLLFLIRRFK